MSGSDDIATLIGTVSRLPRDEQYRILRLVQLMTRAPGDTQSSTQQKLRELLASAPASHAQCIARIDQLIAELELSLLPEDPRLRGQDGRTGLRIFNTSQS